MESAFEDRVSTLEETFRQTFAEFRNTLTEEFARLRREPGTPRMSSAEETVSEYQMAVKKVELPPFDGEDPVGWITRAETYFEVQETSEEVKVRLAKLSMEGTTIHWFNLLRDTENNLTWTRLKQALIERYGGRQSDNPFEELKDLQQIGDVEEYITEFEYISSQVARLPEDQYLGYFLGGLKLEIRLKVRTLNPRSRIQAMKMARDVETELRGALAPRSGGGSRLGRKFKESNPKLGEKGDFGSNSGPIEKIGYGSGLNPGQNKENHGCGPANSGNSEPSQPKSTLGTIVSPNFSQKGRDDARRGNGSHTKGIRHLPYSELMDRKARGLCFRCGERYNPLHQCAEKQLRLVILNDDETVNDAGEIIAIELQKEDEAAGTVRRSIFPC
ncbi:hypothetical protein QL285_003186 [Trifolium repens]|nr:hypothetical protein QL285_003186 [Trifolium repens]